MSGGLATLRVLVVDEKKLLKQLLPPILTGAGIREVAHAAGFKAALDELRATSPHLVFIDLDDGFEDSLAFVRTIRQPRQPWNMKAAVILLASSLDHEQLRAARDGGVNEILMKPLTTAAVMNRLTRVILKPRPFITSPSYNGPERRGRSSPTYAGPHRRLADRHSSQVLLPIG